MNMNCQKTRQQIKTATTHDAELTDEAATHIGSCELCHRWYSDFKLDAALQKLAVPEPDDAFVNRAILNASQNQTYRFGKAPRLAIAASIAVVSMVLGLFLGQGRTADMTFEVAMSPYEDRMVEVVINAVQARDQAALTISLAEHLELSGYPERRVVQWNTDLAEGKNLLTLPLRLTGKDDTHFTVRMAHGTTEKLMRVEVHAKPHSPRTNESIST
jgi:hypothetical protein